MRLVSFTRRRLGLWPALVVGLLASACSQAARADEPGNEPLIVAERGTVPIILSAPHGGTTEIPGAARRTGEGVHQFVTVRDVRTFELASKLADAIEAEMGGRPYIVLAQFRRTQVDANRDPENAYESPEAGVQYHAFHDALRRFSQEVQDTWGSGIVLDIHGQARSPQMIYRGTRSGRTVSSLLERHGLAALEGPDSIFGVLAEKGYEIAPVPTGEGDGPATETRFTGGHIVVAHGSAEGGTVDAIQLEFGTTLRAPDRLDQTAADVAEAIAIFSRHFGPAAVEEGSEASSAVGAGSGGD